MEAIIILNKKINGKIVLVIGGSRNIFTSRLEQEIKDIKGEEYIKLIGFVEDDHLSVLYKNSVGFVYPSLTEGYGLQGLEAMDAGTVVLASNISVFKEIYGDIAFYFDPRNPYSISASMEYIVNLKEADRNLLIGRNKEFIKRYSWSKMARETLSVYNSFL